MRRIMKQLLLLNIILAALSTSAHAATIQAYATNVTATDGSFSATAGGAPLSTHADIQAIITSDANTAIFGANPDDYSIIRLDFGDTIVKTGSGGDTLGADLAIISLWNGYDYSFGLQAFNTNDASISFYNYFVTASSPEACDNTGACFDHIKSTSINLYDNVTGAELDDGIEISYFNLFIGGPTYNGAIGDFEAYSNFSLAGAYHTDVAAVPLPLPAILFASGLGLLGLVGRRSKA